MPQTGTLTQNVMKPSHIALPPIYGDEADVRAAESQEVRRHGNHQHRHHRHHN